MTNTLRDQARRAIENALGVDLVPLLDAEEITVTATITEEAADAVIKLVRYEQGRECVTELLDALGEPMPDRPLDTVWNHLLGEVRALAASRDEWRDRAGRLSTERDEALTKVYEQAQQHRDEPKRLRLLDIVADGGTV